MLSLPRSAVRTKLLPIKLRRMKTFVLDCYCISDCRSFGQMCDKCLVNMEKGAWCGGTLL
jgi:hypothetical protein